MWEVLTLQFGGASNRVSEDLWRSVIREAGITSSEEELIDVTLKEQKGRFVPRAVAFGTKNSFHRKQIQQQSDEIHLWNGNVQIIPQDPYSGEYSTILPSHATFEVNEFRDFDPLNNFYDGIPSTDGKIRRQTIEQACDVIRKNLEECDSIQGFQCIVDIDSSWGGFATEVIKEIREECPTSFVLCFGHDSNYHMHDDDADELKKDGRRAINLASSTTSLNDLCSLYIPFSPQHPGLGAVAWNCLSSTYRYSNGSTMRELSYRPSMKVMELGCLIEPPSTIHSLNGQDKLRLWQKNSLLSRDLYALDLPQRCHYQQLTFRGSFNVSSSDITGEPFDYWKLNTVGNALFSFHDKEFKSVATSLSVSSTVSTYLNQLAANLDRADRRVLHEFNQSGMSSDGVREMHSDLLTLADSCS